MKNIDELTHLVLGLDHEDLNDLFIAESITRNNCNIKFDNHEIYFDDDIVFITGIGYVSSKDFGGNGEPEYTEYEVDFDVIISANDNEGNEVKASFCTIYLNPKKI